MLVWRDPSQVEFEKPVITLGFFDGVHLGHIQLLQQLRSIGAELKRPTLVISLWPHPRIVLGNDPSKLKLLTMLEYKTQLIADAGVDAMLVLDFNLELAALEPLDFLEEVLYKNFNPSAILMGYDHRFGHGGKGDFALLQKFASQKGIPAYLGTPLAVDGVTVSSTHIRTLLLQGEAEQAARSLGRDYGFYGTVVRGKQLGHTIGFPTANVQPMSGWQQLPCHGVYSGYCILPSISPTERRTALINVGTRPTIDIDGHVSIEAYIPSLHTSIYNQSIYVSFHHKIRNELKFATLDALRQQITRDLEELKELS